MANFLKYLLRLLQSIDSMAMEQQPLSQSIKNSVSPWSQSWFKNWGTLFMQSISANNRIVPSAFWFSSTVGLMFSLTGSSFFSVLWNKNSWVAMTLSDWSRWHHLYFLLILLTERNSYIFEKQKQKVIWRFVNPKFSVIRLHFTFTRHIVFKWIFWMFLIVAKF